MNDEGPAVRFSQDSTVISFWANRTGLKPLDGQQQEAASSQAREFLLARGSMLIADYGWQEDKNGHDYLLNLSKPGQQPHLLLPTLFASFLEASEADKWSEMFDLLFHAEDSTTSGLCITSPPPLADIFYLLQTLLPGMLLVYRTDDVEEVGVQERARAVPPAAWVEEHKGLLQTIFGDHDTERYDRLVAAAADRELAEEVEIICSYENHERYSDDDDYDDYDEYLAWHSYQSDSDDFIKDIAACDEDCNYCGKCVIDR